MGTATYSYVPAADGSRTFQGPFRFTAADKQSTITGGFASNVKSGPWRIQLVNQPVASMVVDYRISCVATGSFLKGQLTGPWSITRTITASAADNIYSRQVQAQVNNASLLTGSKPVSLSGKQRTFTHNTKAEFTHNQFTGTFSDTRPQDHTTLTGHFSTQGYCHGSWLYGYTEKGIAFQTTYVFDQGILTRVVTRNTSTGETTVVQDESKLAAAFLQKLPADSSGVLVDEKYYRVEELDPHHTGGPVAKALRGWFGAGNVVEASLANEVMQGTLPIRLPLRRLVVDEQRSSQAASLRRAQPTQATLDADQQQEEQASGQLAAESALESRQQARKDSVDAQNRQRELLLATDYGQLGSSIRDAYKQWAEKQEFETSDQVRVRVQQKGEAEFANLVTSLTAAAKTRYLTRYQGTTANLSRYDADKQQFIVLLEQSDYAPRSGLNDTIRIDMSVETAKKLRGALAGTNQPGQIFHSTPIFQPTEAAIVNNTWTVTKGVLLFGFSPAAMRCLKDLKADDERATQVQSTDGVTYQLNCASCACVNPIQVKSLRDDFLGADLTGSIIAEPSPQRPVVAPVRPSVGAIGVGVLSAAVLGSNHAIVPSSKKKAAPVAPAHLPTVELFQAEWRSPNISGEMIPFTPANVGVNQ